MLKKIVIFILLVLLFVFSACNSNHNKEEKNQLKKIKNYHYKNVNKEINNLKKKSISFENSLKDMKFNEVIEFKNTEIKIKLKKESLIKYLIEGDEYKDHIAIEHKIKELSSKLIKKYNLKKIFNIKNADPDFVLYKFMKGAIIHKFISEKSQTFENKNFEQAIIIRAIVLYVIADRETSYFNFDPYIFSKTQAWGVFQVNGNTLGFNFNKFINLLNINYNKLSSELYDETVNSEQYKILTEQYFKNKKKYSKDIFYAEKSATNNIAKKIFNELDIFLINNGKYIKYLAKNTAKAKIIKRKYIKNIATFVRRVTYGIEYYGVQGIEDIKPYRKREIELSLAGHLSSIYIKNQGFFALLVFESKYAALSKKLRKRLHFKMTENNFKNTIFYVSSLYNGGEKKEIYGKIAAKKATLALKKIILN